MSTTFDLPLVVAAVKQETPLIRSFELRAATGGPLPAWSAGAHIKVRLPDGDERSYSLVNASPDPAATRNPAAYRLGVRLEAESKGGSRFMHGLKAGDAVQATRPGNNFELKSHAGAVRLVAGGIGVTPILSMAAARRAAGLPFTFHYAGRSRDQFAFLPEIQALAGAALRLHVDAEAGGFFDVPALMRGLGADEPLYLCGPTPMIDAAIAAARELGWPPGRLNFEIFSAAAPQAGDAGFEVVLRQSGRSFTVPPDKSILDVLIDAGIDPLYDCKRGDCGVCQCAVVEGEPDHRDYVLSEAEKASGKLMQICVSRARTPKLVLDL